MADEENERMGIMSATSMLRTVGKLGGPSGRGLIMFRTLAVASTSAAIVGICGAFAGGLLASGGGHFFVIGSCIGYVTSALYFYRNQIRQAFLAFDDYPELMRLHLMMNFPLMRFQRMDLRPGRRGAERERLASSWMLSSMVAAAYQTASPSIDDLLQRKEQNLIAELSHEPVVEDEEPNAEIDFKAEGVP